MIYGIIGLVLSALAYIQYLRNQIQNHLSENALLKSQAKNAEWDTQINQSKLKITETEKDYEDAKKVFHDHYGTGTSKPGSSSGSES